MIGETLGSYRVARKLGEGGMGVVYVAEHALLGSKAVVKLLHPQLSQNREMVNRFFNEAKAATLVEHKGIVRVFDFGYHASGSAYIAMEYLDGESLADRLRREGRLALPVALGVARQIASALAAAHHKGIVHRDLKPDNVFLVADEDAAHGVQVKVLDFGIAKLSGGDSAGAVRTQTQALMGTPAYMSPEQCRGAKLVDHRADVYSLGCILYELVAGRPPFVAEEIGEIMAAHMRDAPPAPSTVAAGVPPALEALILKALAKKPEDRHQSMQELAGDLAALSGRLSSELVTVVADASQRPPPASPASTTLRGAAGEVPARPPEARRRRLPLILGAGAAVIAAVVAVLVIGGGGGAAKPGTGDRVATRASPDAVEMIATAPAPPSEDAAQPTPPLPTDRATLPATPPVPATAADPTTTARPRVRRAASATTTAPPPGKGTPGDCPSWQRDYGAAMRAKDYACVKTILMPSLNANIISGGEARYLKAVCTALGDTACATRAAAKIN